MIKDVVINISGGRTSAYMAQWMLQNRAIVAEHLNIETKDLKYHFIFANTGLEHEDTLRFMKDFAEHYKVPITWVEAEVHLGKRKSSTAAITGYPFAYRNSEWENEKHPFHAYIRKYGIPNIKFQSCTRELKLNPIKSYLKSIGLGSSKQYYLAIGIREDESRRVSKNAEIENIIYPLVDLHPTDKDEVLDFWKQFEWDLKIPEWQGNCVTCYKKSFKKLKKVYQESPEHFLFNEYMEEKYPRLGPEFKKYENAPDRVFFRLNNSAKTLKMLFNSSDADANEYIRRSQDSGCSESCELLPTE